jgi:putative flippase GtrA
MAGCVGALINMGVLFILVDIFGMWYLMSAVISFVSALITTFFIQKFWAFKNLSVEKKHVKRQAILYVISSTTCLFINLLILFILVDILGVWYLFSQFLSLGLVSIGSFFFNKLVTFKKEEI